jgi:hypothetical protein
MSNNICDCPNPPGGRAICEPDQLAICRIKDGEPEMQCLDPPALIGSPLNAHEYLEWALSEITGEVHFSIREEFSPSEIAMFQSGTYKDSTGAVTKFRIPNSIWGKLAEEQAEKNS